MTWKTLLSRLRDPTIALALLAAVLGEVQAQSHALTELVGPTLAGRLLSAGAVLAAVLRILQTLPARQPPDTHDDGTAGESQ